MSGVVRRKAGGATSKPADDGQDQGGTGNGQNGSISTQRPRVPTKRSWLRLFFAASFAVFSFFLVSVIAVSYVVDPQIHSCSVYLPMKAEAFSAIVESLISYAEDEGVWTLLTDMFAVVRSELLGLAPMPELIERVSGKHLLMIGGARTWIALQRARQLGVRLTLIDDPKLRSEVGSYVHSFIGVENFSRVSVLEQEKVLAAINSHQQDAAVPLDGVFTLVEDHGPLVSFIAEQMRLPGSPEAASKIARNKFLVRQAMREAALPVPRYALIESKADLAAAAEAVKFPAFLKPVYGVQATFAAKIRDMAELTLTFEKFQESIDTAHHPIYHYGTQMILESLLAGPEVQLELMVLGGDIVFHSFSSEYSARRDTLSFPVRLTAAQRASQLKLASDTVKAIGLTHGLVHFELFQDPKLGSHIIEINNRLSRGFLPRNFAHQQFFSTRSVDYYGSVFALALNQTPVFKERGRAPLNIAMYLDEPSTDWWTVDPKDAPNRGWESEGLCGVFVAPTAEQAWGAGQPFQQKRSKDRRALDDEVKIEEIVAVAICLSVSFVTSIISAALFFL